MLGSLTEQKLQLATELSETKTRLEATAKDLREREERLAAGMAEAHAKDQEVQELKKKLEEVQIEKEGQER